MKKILSILTGFCACVMLAQAEDMEFVTTLSAPVGTFMTLETANHKAAVHAPTTNFGTTKSEDSTISITSPSGKIPELGKIVVQRNIEITGPSTVTTVVSTPKVQVGNNSTIIGKNLWATKVRLADSAVVSPKVTVSNAVTGNTETKVRGAIIDKMSFKGTNTNIDIPTGDESLFRNQELFWSNQYLKCSSGTGSCYAKQYLLKTDGCRPPNGKTSYTNNQGCDSDYNMGQAKYVWDEDSCSYKKVKQYCYRWRYRQSTYSYTGYQSYGEACSYNSTWPSPPNGSYDCRREVKCRADQLAQLGQTCEHGNQGTHCRVEDYCNCQKDNNGYQTNPPWRVTISYTLFRCVEEYKPGYSDTSGF